MSERSQVLVFDMDGVLVEVTESYRETVIRTVEHFTGQTVSNNRLQELKNQGGWNNDWLLSQKLCRDFGVELPYATVVDHFNYLFLDQGMIHRERWLPRDGFFDRMSERFDLAIFTGRTNQEARITLEREKVRERFTMVITADDVANEKPAPDGLLQIAAQNPGKKLLYVGDTVDDARSARSANVPFIGIASKVSPRRDELVERLRLEGAIQVIEDVNEIG